MDEVKRGQGDEAEANDKEERKEHEEEDDYAEMSETSSDCSCDGLAHYCGRAYGCERMEGGPSLLPRLRLREQLWRRWPDDHPQQKVRDTSPLEAALCK